MHPYFYRKFVLLVANHHYRLNLYLIRNGSPEISHLQLILTLVAFHHPFSIKERRMNSKLTPQLSSPEMRVNHYLKFFIRYRNITVLDVVSWYRYR